MSDHHDEQPRDGCGGNQARPKVFGWLAGPFVAAALWGSATFGLAQPGVSSSPEPADAKTESNRESATDALADQYIVIFGNGVGGPGIGDRTWEGARRVKDAIAQSKWAQRVVKERGGSVRYEYRRAIIGFSASIPRSARLQLEMRFMPNTLFSNKTRFLDAAPRIEQNRNLALPETSGQQVSPSQGRTGENLDSVAYLIEPQPTLDLRSDVPAGLDRIDQRLPGGDQKYTSRNDGDGVHVYVLDSGINLEHKEFEGRVLSSREESFDDPLIEGHSVDDCRGHGTQVSGIIAGSKFGVAKKVKLHPVRVFNCGGTTSTDLVIAGIDWVADHYIRSKGAFPAIANLSAGQKIETGLSSWPAYLPRPPKIGALEAAVSNSVLAGIAYVVAAGNDQTDACLYEPGIASAAITVGSSDPRNDYRAESSNVGTCVDLFAPGVGIVTASSGGQHATTRRSSTSMAAPHVSGVAALYLHSHRQAKPPEVWQAILRAASVYKQTPDWCGIIGPEDAPNVLLHWGAKRDDGIEDLEPSPASTDECPLSH